MGERPVGAPRLGGRRLRRVVAAVGVAGGLVLGGAGLAAGEALPGDRAEAVGVWGAADLPPLLGRPSKPIVAIAATPSGQGYWLLAADGTLAAHGDARWYPPSGPIPAGDPVVGMAVSPTGLGYWLVDRVGRVFAYGDAPLLATSGGAITPGQPATGISPAPGGRGYWVVAADGSAVAYGEARLAPSGSGVPPAGVVALVPTPSGAGFWLASSDGRVFPYGDAGWFGALDAAAAGSPVVGMVATPAGLGYFLALADDRVVPFGDAGPFGAWAACPARPASGIAWRPGGGYWIARSIAPWPGPAATAGLRPVQQVAAEGAQMAEALRVQQGCQAPGGARRLVRPVGAAPIASPFGWRTHPIYGERQLHAGVDFSRPAGYPVAAAADGVVVSVSTRVGYGLAVVIDHDGRLGTVYAHLSGAAVGVGQRVGAGRTIGWVGSSGFATGPHLHFEVRVNGDPVDPVGWL
ncbi:MAG: M23 family metallopeptidase [Acidimicrobiales bacterium]|nr:M23 family metallopeptidase [Acidimicrobiales bacterium]